MGGSVETTPPIGTLRKIRSFEVLFATGLTLFLVGPRSARTAARAWILSAVAASFLAFGNPSSWRGVASAFSDDRGALSLSGSGGRESAVVLTTVLLVSCATIAFARFYMAGDPHLRAFVAFLVFFLFAMATLVLADDLLTFFAGWEGVGLSSYLLVSFWSTRHRACTAALRAVAFNACGDAALLTGILRLRAETGATSFSLVTALSPETSGWFLIAGAFKSALLLAHPWLPEAMEGPAPVSALLHSATLVAAGALLLLRLPVDAGRAGTAACLWGAATAVVAARAASDQRDAKRLVACSTCSHLGLVATAWGCGATTPALFHLVAHAFFKAELFVVVGWIVHRSLGEQHVGRVAPGGIAGPLFLTLLSLAGWPLFSGGLSKERVLAVAEAADGPRAACLLIAAAGTATAGCYATHLACAFWCRK